MEGLADALVDAIKSWARLIATVLGCMALTVGVLLGLLVWVVVF